MAELNDYEGISLNKIDDFDNYVKNNTVSKIAGKAMSKTSIEDVCYDTAEAAKMNHKFSIEIPTMTATNQKSSGRCWLFSALNVLREQIGKNANIENIEISQNYISFFDKIEKSNYFLESMIKLAGRPTDDRTVSWLLYNPIGDGGQWDMFVALVKKYGLVPKEAMPETYQSSNTGSMNRIINTKLREDAAALRNALNGGETLEKVRGMKLDMLKDIYNILSVCLGNPPKTFDFEYVDKDKNYHIDHDLTSHTFYDKYIGVNLDDFVSVINAPTSTKPFNRTYTVSYLGNVAESDGIRYLNLEMSELKSLVIKQLENNELVWFGCDTGKFGCREEGIWATEVYDYESPFSIKMGMSKGDMLDYGQSSMGHAMVITGVNLDDNKKADKWKIENSWGTDRGKNGYYIISDDWFDRYVYQACINKKYLSDEQKAILDQERIVLDPWDPMGTLAF